MLVRLTGGLGNQMFGYAFGRSVAERRGEQVRYYFSRSTIPYQLNLYNVDAQMGTPFSQIYTEPGFEFDPNVYSAPKDANFQGYWQSPRYFNEVAVRKELTLKVPVSDRVKKLADEFHRTGAIFVHRRRGDYLNPGTKEFHGMVSEEYYEVAIKYISNQGGGGNLPVVSFSDDDSLRSPGLEGLNMHEDLYLMRHCQHAVIANSTFSWWGAWLQENPNKVVVAPKQWFTDTKINTDDLIPANWVRL